MPIDPDLPGRLALTLFRLASGAEGALIQRIAGALAKGIGSPDWAVRQLANVVRLRAGWEATLGSFFEEMQRGAYGAVIDAGQIGRDAALVDLRGLARREAARSTLPGARALVGLAEELAGVVVSTRYGVLRSAEDVFRSVVAQVSAQTILGANTRRMVAQQALDRLVGRGLTGFVDVSGRRWQLASYVEMASRTVAQRAMVQGHSEVLREAGHDLVIVSNAPQECKLCRPWENKILSLSGDSVGQIQVPSAVDPARLVTVEVAGSLVRARAAGLYHPNCRHSHSLYLPGVTRPAPGRAPDPEGDLARQHLRALERRVRRAKMLEAAAFDDAARTRARIHVRAIQAQIRAHVDATPGLLRQPARERIGVAR